MGEHFPRSTVSVSAWCNKCRKHTHHRVDDGLKGPCLVCVKRLEDQHNATAKAEPEKQLTFFGGAA